MGGEVAAQRGRHHRVVACSAPPAPAPARRQRGADVDLADHVEDVGGLLRRRRCTARSGTMRRCSACGSGACWTNNLRMSPVPHAASTCRREGAQRVGALGVVGRAARSGRTRAVDDQLVDPLGEHRREQDPSGPPSEIPPTVARSHPTASITARMSSTRSLERAEVRGVVRETGTLLVERDRAARYWPPRHERPRRRTARSQFSSTCEMKPGTQTTGTPSPHSWYAMVTSPLFVYCVTGGSTALPAQSATTRAPDRGRTWTSPRGSPRCTRR